MTIAKLLGFSSSPMAPSAKVTKAAKVVKGNDLRMFFGPGGSQPKPIPVATASQVSTYHTHMRVEHVFSPILQAV